MHTENDPNQSGPHVPSTTSSITSRSSTGRFTTQSSQEIKQDLETLYEAHGGKDVDHHEIAEKLHQAGVASLGEENYAEAKTSLIEALSMYRALQADEPEEDEAATAAETYQEVIADILKHLGIVYLAQNEPAQAQSGFTQALSIVKALHDQNTQHRDIAELEYHLGLALLSQSNAATAETHLNNALSMFQRLSGSSTNQLELAETRYHLGLAYYQQQKYTTGQDQLSQALTIFQRLLGETSNHPKIASTSFNLGLVSQAQQRNTQAIAYFNQALSAYKVIYPNTAHLDLAQLHHHLGEVYLAENNLTSAKNYLEKAVIIYQALFMDNPEHESLIAAKNLLRSINPGSSGHAESNSPIGERTALNNKPQTNYQAFNTTVDKSESNKPDTSQSTRWCCWWNSDSDDEEDTKNATVTNPVPGQSMDRK